MSHLLPFEHNFCYHFPSSSCPLHPPLIYSSSESSAIKSLPPPRPLLQRQRRRRQQRCRTQRPETCWRATCWRAMRARPPPLRRTTSAMQRGRLTPPSSPSPPLPLRIFPFPHARLFLAPLPSPSPESPPSLLPPLPPSPSPPPLPALRPPTHPPSPPPRPQRYALGRRATTASTPQQAPAMAESMRDYFELAKQTKSTFH
jgi:hypothetical protein